MSFFALRRPVPALSPHLAPELPPRGRISWEGVGAILAVLALWQFGSTVLPPFLFPSLQVIVATLGRTLSDAATLGSIALTYGRIILWLSVTFVFASALGIWAARSGRLDRALLPLIQLKQGVPGVCWAIFAIIWFEDIEIRIAFVVVISTIPSFFFQARDGVRAISADLWDMVRALRPTRWQTLDTLVIPALVPAFLTAWRINLGNGARITITAELLAGVSGIGHQLRTAQEQFRMDDVMAWTAIIAAFVLVTDYGMSRLEKHLLRWRRQTEEGL